MTIEDLIKFVLENKNDPKYIEDMLRLKYKVCTGDEVGEDSENTLATLKTSMGEARAMISSLDDYYNTFSCVIEDKKSSKLQILKAFEELNNMFSNTIESAMHELDV